MCQNAVLLYLFYTSNAIIEIIHKNKFSIFAATGFNLKPNKINII